MFGDNLPPEIDVHEIAKDLQPGQYMPVLCEGCVMRAVSKNEAGEIEIAREDLNGEIKFISLDEWEKLERHLRV